MGYIRYIILSFVCSAAGYFADGLLSNSEQMICTITFFFIPTIYMVYKIYDDVLTRKEKEEKDKIE